jgi:hypothetical protein
MLVTSFLLQLAAGLLLVTKAGDHGKKLVRFNRFRQMSLKTSE